MKRVAKPWRLGAIGESAVVAALLGLGLLHNFWLVPAVLLASFFHGRYLRSKMSAAPLEDLIEVKGDALIIQTDADSTEDVDLSGVVEVLDCESDGSFLCLVLDRGEHGIYRKYVPFFHPDWKRVAEVANAHVRRRSVKPIPEDLQS